MCEKTKCDDSTSNKLDSKVLCEKSQRSNNFIIFLI